MTEASKRYPTPVEFLEQHGYHGERLVTGMMELQGCSRAEAIRQIRWAHGETRGCHRVIRADEGRRD